MTPLYLLDTNTVSYLIKRHPQATEHLLAVPMHSVCISAITAGELAFGLAKRPEAVALKAAVDEFLRRVEVLPWDDAVAQFNKYSAKGGDKAKANLRIKSAQDAASKKNAKTKITVENVVELNSPFFDYGLSYSGPSQIVFSSSRQASAGSYQDPITGESFMDLFYSDQDKKGKWSSPQPLPGAAVQGPEQAARERPLEFPKVPGGQGRTYVAPAGQ